MKARIRFYLFLILSISIWSCSSSDSNDESSNDINQGELHDEAYYQNLIGIGLSKNPNWSKHWGTIIGPFEAGDFHLTFTDSIDPMEMPEVNPIGSGDPLSPYQFPHPEGKGTMDIYLYKVEAQETLDKPFLNPDSEVIWFREDGMKERLLFMGPSGMFEEGGWLNAQEFLVLGYFQEEEGFHPMIWIIDVDNHVFRQFRMDKFSESYLPQSYLDQKLKSVNLSPNGN
ncbi:hypothetical protein DFQ04_0564 [Algoriphagus boseongensis]|uniref:Uncharacterized protein n=1 Tax=Algoriphagus boseongensis TaxID=1442587 RepID=A0A4R6T7U8_9BACT|nr:hypothetical protein [Algoriphagus boseongensis]TDQ18756.1 hypothetical protein DFQ04_0564 [Algoriphagus boseongensis]